MKKRFIYFILPLLLTACAKQEEFDPTAFEEGAFARWMAKYHPGIPSLEGDEAGIYVEWFDQNPDGARLREGYWLEMDYTVSDGNGDIFYTRSPQNARLLFGAQLDPAVRYVPEQVHYVPTEMTQTHASGQIRFLSQMAEGDSVRLYLAPEWGYFLGMGFTYTAQHYFGYAKSNTRVAAQSGLIVEMRLNRVIRDIDLYEREQVTRWAADSLGITDPADSIAPGVYMRKIVENPAGELVPDSTVTVKVSYTGRFLDGHLLDTNIDSVARAHGIKLGEDRIGPADFDLNGFISAVRSALLQMRVGERIRLVTVSDQAYGTEGLIDENDNHVIVPPYTPLEFEFYLESFTE